MVAAGAADAIAGLADIKGGGTLPHCDRVNQLPPERLLSED
jgi:hypothetical protein